MMVALIRQKLRSSMKGNNYALVGISKMGIPMAKALKPAIEQWLSLTWKKNIYPADLGFIAKSVVDIVAEERGYYKKYNKSVSAKK